MGLPLLDGVGHVDLSVRDAARSAHWWQRVLGFRLVNIDDRQGRKGYGGPLIVFRDPDNIQLEVWAFDWDQVTTNQV